VGWLSFSWNPCATSLPPGVAGRVEKGFFPFDIRRTPSTELAQVAERDFLPFLNQGCRVDYGGLG
jgi:hypothetical protein